MELLTGASRRPDRERKRSRFDIIVENVLLPIRPGQAHDKAHPKFHARFASHAPTRVSSQTMFSKSEILKLTPSPSFFNAQASRIQAELPIESSRS